MDDHTAEAIARVASSVGPAVVAVGRGAGLVFAPGQVVTNAHNLRGDTLEVRFADGRVAEATLRGADVEADLAVLAVDTGEASPAAWGHPAGLGAVVLAVAPTRNGPRVTAGRVSATGQAFRGPRGRLIPDAIEHTAPMAPGSSGGPLVDPEGHLVGINTHRRGDAFYLAVPATDDLRDRLGTLATGENVERPRLGIAVTPSHVATRMRRAVGLDDRPGVLVRGVGEDSPAAAADLRRGDLIVAVHGDPIEHADDLFQHLATIEPGATLTLGIVRGNEELDVSVSF